MPATLKTLFGFDNLSWVIFCHLNRNVIYFLSRRTSNGKYVYSHKPYICMRKHSRSFLFSLQWCSFKRDTKENIIKVLLSVIAIYSPHLNMTTFCMFCNTVVFVEATERLIRMTRTTFSDVWLRDIIK